MHLCVHVCGMCTHVPVYAPFGSGYVCVCMWCVHVLHVFGVCTCMFVHVWCVHTCLVCMCLSVCLSKQQGQQQAR